MLPSSLSSRIYYVGIVGSLAMLALVFMLATSIGRTKTAFQYVAHTEEVIRTVDEMLGDLREAESGQRGFLLTRSYAYLDTFQDRINEARKLSRNLATLTDDNLEQKGRAVQLGRLVDLKVRWLRRPIDLARTNDFEGAIKIIAGGRGRYLMEDVSRRAIEIKITEKGLLKLRVAEAERQAASNKRLLIFAGPAVVGLFIVLIWILLVSIRRPLAELLSTMTAFGEGAWDTRARDRTGTREFDRLARTYNVMAQQLAVSINQQKDSDEQLQKVNAELRRRGTALQARSEAIEVLSGMAHRMQAARTDEELAEVISCFLPRILPSATGALYAHNNSRNLLVKLAEWGKTDGVLDSFAPDECWGLRRGQRHVLNSCGGDVVCGHAEGQCLYHCEPVLAGGEVVGLLYLEGMIGDEEEFRLAPLTENIALALVNQRLQKGLKEQSIRDPLTNLYNRRYLEETLSREAARAARKGEDLGVIMCDVDHFKRFNDDFGHEAGDILLRAVAETIQGYFRDGDIACRYGGEEFAIIAPGASVSLLAGRAEDLREAIRAIAIRHDGQPLGPISMSFGVAVGQGRLGLDGMAIIREADAALYAAKRGGRNRVVISAHKQDDEASRATSAEIRERLPH